LETAKILLVFSAAGTMALEKEIDRLV